MKNLTKTKSTIAGLLLLLGLAAPAHAQLVSTGRTRVPLASDWDLEGVAASTNDIVTVVNLTNAALTVAAQPDVPKKMTITVVDTTPSIVAGTVTIVGVDQNGAAATEVVSIAAGAGTYTSTGYWTSITSITVAAASVLGGAGDETIKVGSAAPTLYAYPYTVGDSGKILSEYFGPLSSGAKVKTTGSSVTVTAYTASTGPFTNVAVGDELKFIVDGVPKFRYVATRADANTITVDQAIDLSAGTGYNLFVRKRTIGYGDLSGWIDVSSFQDFTFEIQVKQNTDTGGVSYRVECTMDGTERLTANSTVVSGPTNVASAASSFVAVTVVAPWEYCRLGFLFGTNDDADASGAASEKISAVFLGRK